MHEKPGYVNRGRRSVPVQLLETYTVSRHDTSHCQLDEKSLNILRKESGFPPLNSNTSLNLKSSLESEPPQHVACAPITKSSSGYRKDGRTCTETSESLTAKKFSDLRSHRTLIDVLPFLVSRAFHFFKPEDSIPGALFNGLLQQVSDSSLFHPVMPFSIVEMKLYQAITNLFCTFVPSGNTREMRRLPITKTRSILKIGLSGGHRNLNEEKMHGSKEARRNAIRSEGPRLLVHESRAGLLVELSQLVLSERAWKKNTEDWVAPDASWEADLEQMSEKDGGEV